MSVERQLTAVDALIAQFDRVLKSASGPHIAKRPYPGAAHSESISAAEQKRQIARLMRVNHAGEIAAQALYHGQASVARDKRTRDALLHAAEEESDHLSWCATRLAELDDHPSRLDPFWYAGSFAIGALAGLAGDKHSLGFVAETENQVIEHLQSHLARLPDGDARTRAIVEQMMQDEARHGGEALENGGQLPPAPIRMWMKLTAKIMTSTSEYI